MILGHLTTAIDRPDDLRRLADRGATLGFDLFGFDHSLLGPGRWPPSDHDVVRVIADLARDGYADRIVLGQDIGVRTAAAALGRMGLRPPARARRPVAAGRGCRGRGRRPDARRQPGAAPGGGGMTGKAAPPVVADATDRLTRLSPSLWWYRDTCNVYLWTSGERGLLIDFGSGGILDVLERTGVREIEAIVHTHHHRDQCGGDERAVELGIPIWVPERERGLFATAEAFWTTRRTYDSYDASSLGFTRATSVPVARGLRDHERVTWSGGTFEAVPTPGHTKGSLSLVAEIDGASWRPAAT